MGRNAGAQCFVTHVYDGTNHIITHYCQQHGQWDQLDQAVLAVATNVFWVQHIGNVAPHGCNKQS